MSCIPSFSEFIDATDMNADFISESLTSLLLNCEQFNKRNRKRKKLEMSSNLLYLETIRATLWSC